MNIQSLVVIVLRLMALDFLLRVSIQLIPQILMNMRLSERSPMDDSRSFVVLPLLVVTAIIICAVLFWVFALPIARFVTRGVPHDLSFGAMSLVDCYSIAFMSVGLFYIASHLPLVLNWTHYLFKAAASTSGDSWKEGLKGYDISQAFVPFIVGVILFINGRRWAVALAWKHAEVLPPVSPAGDEKESDNR